MNCKRVKLRNRDGNQAALFAMSKQIAASILPALYDGTQLSASDVERVRSAVRQFIENAFDEALQKAKAEHDCRTCETSFRVKTLYPAVEICIEEFKRLWKEQLTLN